METASVSHDEEHQHAVISFADGAKVRRIIDISKFTFDFSRIALKRIVVCYKNSRKTKNSRIQNNTSSFSF